MKYEACGKCRDEVLWYALALNIGLSVFKGGLGVMAGSAAMVADAFHSAADVVASVVTMLSLKISSKPADAEHPYGHGHIQFISSAIVGLILVGGAMLLLVGSIKNLMGGEVEPPAKIALVGALISVFLNELMFRYQHCVGVENNSPAIIANAWDNRSDAFSSAAVLVGIAFAAFGYPIADPIAAVGVSILVIKLGMELVIEAIDGLMDSSPEITDLKQLYALAREAPGVMGVSYIRARRVGEDLHVDVEVFIDDSLKVYEGHMIAELLKDKILGAVEHASDVKVYLALQKAVKDKGNAKPAAGWRRILKATDAAS